MQTAASPDELALNRLTLRFKNPDTEVDFRAWHLEGFVDYMLYMWALYIITYSIYGFILDYLTLGDNLLWSTFLRSGLAVPLMTLTLVLIFFNRKIADKLSEAAVYAAGFSVIAVSILSEPPYNYAHYTGLILVIVGGASLIRVNYLHILVMQVIFFSLYALSLYYLSHATQTLIATHVSISLVAIIVILIESYSLDLSIRSGYVKDRLLTEEKLKFETANRAKTEFLAVMTHELRTPLTSIIGFSELMEMQLLGPLGNDKYKSYASDIHNSGKYLLDLIQDVLDLSRAEIGKVSLQESDFNLAELLVRCSRILTGKASEKNLELNIDQASANFTLHADERLIMQAIVNVLGNSVKFTPKDGHVWVSVVRDKVKGFVGISIKDDGIGISKEDLPKIAKPFVQASNIIRSEHGGAGIGLALTKKIIELHGGKIAIESELGKGTTVTLYLPETRIG